MQPVVRDAILRAARENDIDPATALAIADRESSGDVNGRAPGSSAYGLFQLLKSERNTYGGNSADPYEQATAWARYIQGTKAEMQRGLGRDPTGPELYLGHYFGGTRAARMVAGKIPGESPVASVFSSQELAANPNIGRAGTTGSLTSSIMSDIARRSAKYAGAGAEPDPASGAGFDPAKWGTPVGPAAAASPAQSEPTGGPIQGKPVPFTQPDQGGTPITTPRPPLPPPLPQQVAQGGPIQPGEQVPYTSGQSILG